MYMYMYVYMFLIPYLTQWRSARLLCMHALVPRSMPWPMKAPSTQVCVRRWVP